MIAAAYLPPDVLSQSQKLALMKIADSADDETRLARPGLTRLAAWVGVTDKRAITIVTELIAKGLVERVEVGKAGRAAVYRVFPLGVPPTPTTPELKERLEARKAAPKNANKARPGVARSAPARPAMTYQDVEEREAARREKSQVEAGFHAGNPGEESGFHGGNPAGQGGRVPPVEPGEFHAGNPLGSSDGTPSFPGSSSVLPFPPTPTADAAGEPASAPSDDSAPAHGESSRGCTKHRGRPAASCRGCGTNPRAGRRREQEEAKEEEQRALGRFWDDWYEEAARRRRRVEEHPEAADEARKAAREAVRAHKSGSQRKT